ncbi:MAG: HU family DNA-binding protein [Parcubacteria group bacterium]
MAWTPPTKHLRDKRLLSEKRFYRLISQQSNYIDPEMAFLFYMSMVAVIGEELRKNKIVRLPHLGDFSLITQKSRPAWVGKSHVVISPREVLKFYPKEHLRRYFNKRQGPLRYMEVLPPPAIE